MDNFDKFQIAILSIIQFAAQNWNSEDWVCNFITLRVTVGHLRVTLGHLRLPVGYLKATLVHIRVTLGHLKVTIGYF